MKILIQNYQSLMRCLKSFSSDMVKLKCFQSAKKPHICNTGEGESGYSSALRMCISLTGNRAYTHLVA